MSNLITGGQPDAQDFNPLHTTTEGQNKETPLTEKVDTLKDVPHPLQTENIQVESLKGKTLTEMKPEDKDKQKLAIIWALKDVPEEDRASLTECVTPLLQGITDKETISLIIWTFRFKVKPEDRKSVSECTAPFLQVTTDGEAISSIIETLSHREDRKNLSETATSFLRPIREIQEINSQSIMSVISMFCDMTPEDREKISKGLSECAAPLLQGITDNEMKQQIVYYLGLQVKPEDRKSVSESVAPLLRGITDREVICDIIKAFAQVKAEDGKSVSESRRSLSESIVPLLQSITDIQTLPLFISTLLTVKAEDRKSVAEWVVPLLQVIENVNISSLINAFKEVKAEERKSVSEYVEPLLRAIPADAANIILVLGRLKAEERKDFSDCAPFLQNIKSDTIRKEVFSILSNRIKADDRKAFAECAALLFSEIKDPIKQIVYINFVAGVLLKKKVNEWKSIAECAVSLLRDVSDLRTISEILKNLCNLKKENRKAVSDCVASFSQQNEELSPDIVLNFLKESSFIPPLRYEALFACCVAAGKGESPLDLLLSQPEMRNEAHAYMLEELKEDKYVESGLQFDDQVDSGSQLYKFAKTIMDHSTAWDVEVNSDLYKKAKDIVNKYNPSTFNVDYELLKSQPEQILQYLPFKIGYGEYPRIQFLDENQQPTEGIDAGGLRRQLQSTLFEQLFNDAARDKKLPFFKVLHEQGHSLGVLPQVRVGQDEFTNDKWAYQTIGQLLAYAYKDSLLTGIHFNNSLFEVLSSLTEKEAITLYYLNIQTWKDLPQSVVVKIFTAMNPTYTWLTKPADQLNEKEKADFDHFMTIRDDDFKEVGKWKNIYEAIGYHIVDNKTPYTEILPAIGFVAKGVYSILAGTQWNDLNQLAPAALSEKIQGSSLLTSEMIIEQLIWSGPAAATAEQTKTFLKQWLSQANGDDLKRFLMAVTGLNSLTKEMKLKMRLYAPANNEIIRPQSHTCFFTLDLPTTSDNQEKFNETMQEFLVNALHGTGFTTE